MFTKKRNGGRKRVNLFALISVERGCNHIYVSAIWTSIPAKNIQHLRFAFTMDGNCGMGMPYSSQSLPLNHNFIN